MSTAGSDAVAARFDADVDAALDGNRETLRALFPIDDPVDGRVRDPASPTTAEAARRRPRGAPTARVSPKGFVLAFGLVAALAAAVYAADPAYRHERHATAVGERRVVPLADGSVVTLDTATRLDVAWHLRSRRVVLDAGQAGFDVAPQARDALGRPFEVAARALRVRVVGTVFGVRLDPGRVTVDVSSGRVEVTGAARPGADGGASAPEPVVLGAGDRLAVTGAGPARVEARAAASPSWRDGRLVFDRAPLAEVLAEAQRYRRSGITLVDDPVAPRIAGLQVSGVFETAETDRLLDLLPKVLPVTVTRRGDGSVVVAARSGESAGGR